jgi:hypothetical protein
MTYISNYGDWYCEEVIEAYFKKTLELDEVLLQLDYSQIVNQTELFNFLNLILTNKYPHKCFNLSCRKKLFFSNTFDNAKKYLDLTLQQFVRIWIAPHNLGKYKNWSINIPFFCCECYKTKIPSKR